MNGPTSVTMPFAVACHHSNLDLNFIEELSITSLHNITPNGGSRLTRLTVVPYDDLVQVFPNITTGIAKRAST